MTSYLTPLGHSFTCPFVIPALASLARLGRIEEQVYKNTEGAAWREMEGNVLG